MSDGTAVPPAGNENTNPSSGAPPAPGVKAYYVPSGDRRLVLAAIDDQVAAAKNAWKAKNRATCDGGDDDDDEGPVAGANKKKEEFFVNCIDRTGESIKERLRSVTIPADEEEVERVLDSFRERLLSASSSPLDPEDDDDGESLSSSSVDDDEDEEVIEFDDNEILDQDAHDQARRLRIRAREISARVISLREETAGRAVEMTRRNLSELLRVHGFSENSEEDDLPGERAVEEEEEGGGDGSCRDPLGQMRVALRTLSLSVRDVDSGLAERLESMKETIGTIDSSVEKYQRMSQGDESVLSRTEKALLASEKPKETVVELVESVEESESPMNPDKKLARLLAGVL